MRKRLLISLRITPAVYRAMLEIARARGITVRQLAEESFTTTVENVSRAVLAASEKG